MSTESDHPVEYWYNTRTRMVEKGRQSSWEHLMGPYSSPEEARHAPEIAQARNELWESDQDSWRDEDS